MTTAVDPNSIDTRTTKGQKFVIHNTIHENEDRRMGEERRKYYYALHLPERRSGEDRRINHISEDEPNKSESLVREKRIAI